MRLTITLSGNEKNGEGNITKGSSDKLKQFLVDDPLLAADFLKDWIFDLEQLYNEAVTEMSRKHIKSILKAERSAFEDVLKNFTNK